MKFKDVENLDEHWQVPCRHACVQKLALLGPAVCSRYNHELDDNWPADVHYRHAYKYYERLSLTPTKSSECFERLSLTPTKSSECFERLWLTFRGGRSHERTNERIYTSGRNTPFQRRRNGIKI